MNGAATVRRVVNAKLPVQSFVVTAGDGARIEYSVRPSRRRTVALYVYRDDRVEVRVPQGTSASSIHRLVLARLPWILRKRRELQSLPVIHAYREGEIHNYLGDPYTLRLSRGRPGSALRGSELHISVADPRDETAVRAMLERWYRRQAQCVFRRCLDEWYAKMSYLGIPYPHLTVRRMRTRWGSCSRQARISLSLALIRTPWACIEYVAVHELCHLVEFNHSPRFHALMDRFLPEWRTRRKHLRQCAVAD